MSIILNQNLCFLKKSDLRWISTGKELLINRKLFDVQEYKVSGDFVFVKGCFDDEENDIENKMEKGYYAQGQAQTDLFSSCFGAIENYFIEYPAIICISVQFKLNTIYHSISVSLEDIIILIPSPPPQA